MSAIVFLVLGIIAPLIAGPLAGLVFIRLLKHGKGWHQIPFWAALIGVNLLVMFWAVSSSGNWLSISSASACVFTPVAAIATVLVMRIAWRRLEASDGIETARKRWFPIGLVLIPVLQMGVFVAFLLFAPWLCKAGLVVCPIS